MVRSSANCRSDFCEPAVKDSLLSCWETLQRPTSTRSRSGLCRSARALRGKRVPGRATADGGEPGDKAARGGGVPPPSPRGKELLGGGTHVRARLRARARRHFPERVAGHVMVRGMKTRSHRATAPSEEHEGRPSSGKTRPFADHVQPPLLRSPEVSARRVQAAARPVRGIFSARRVPCPHANAASRRARRGQKPRVGRGSRPDEPRPAPAGPAKRSGPPRQPMARVRGSNVVRQREW